MGGGSYCAVARCGNSSHKAVRLSKDWSFHRFPKNAAVRKQWIACCKRNDFNPDYAVICSEHFDVTDFEKNFKSELLGVTVKKRLKPGAVPSLNIPNSLYEIEPRQEMRCEWISPHLDATRSNSQQGTDFIQEIKIEEDFDIQITAKIKKDATAPLLIYPSENENSEFERKERKYSIEQIIMPVGEAEQHFLPEEYDQQTIAVEEDIKEKLKKLEEANKSLLNENNLIKQKNAELEGKLREVEVGFGKNLMANQVEIVFDENTRLQKEMLSGMEVEIVNLNPHSVTPEELDKEEVHKAVDENILLLKKHERLTELKHSFILKLAKLNQKLRIKKRMCCTLKSRCRKLGLKSNVIKEQKKLLAKVFSQSQIDALLGKRKVIWSNDDMAMAFTLRQMANKECYRYLKHTLHFPLPSLCSVQKWAASK